MSTTPFPYTAEVTVRFRDLDAMGHVNNAVYFTYMEIARTEFFAHFFTLNEALDLPVILGEAACRYLSPARFGETLRVRLGVSRFGNKSFDFIYRIDGEDERTVATGRSAMVMYDYERQRSFSIPEDFRQRILEFQDGWQAPA